MATRIERDALGEIELPAAALWGAHTERARANFDTGGPTLASLPGFVAAYAHVKIAAARANARFGTIPAAVAGAIEAAAVAVAHGAHLEAFPLAIVQGGGGTSTNMNLNEVLANLAEERLGGTRGAYRQVDPLAHVNRSQSTNDTYPTALAVATLAAGAACVAGLGLLRETLETAVAEAGGRERLGRTCLQDAMPVPAAAGFGAVATALVRTGAGLEHALGALRQVPLGATAVGTGIGAPPGFAEEAVAELSRVTGQQLTPSPDPFDALRHVDGLLGVADALCRAWLPVAQFARDLRLLSSGPVGGLGEVRLPALQPGSSIMPGKVNPVLPELVIQVGYELYGAAAVVRAAAGGGELELNVMEPAITAALLPALARADRTARLFGQRCIAGVRWNDDRVDAHLRGSLAVAVERGHPSHDARWSPPGSNTAE